MKLQTEAVLVVSFGTSHNDTREKTIDKIEEKIANAFSEAKFYRAWTSDRIREKRRKRDGITVDSVKEAFERMKEDGIRSVTVQPTHVMKALEYEKMQNQIRGMSAGFEEIRMGEPLFSTEEDEKKLVSILQEYWKDLKETEVLILMGHGTSHASNCVYQRLETALNKDCNKKMFVGTVEFPETFEQIMQVLKMFHPEKVHLAPFMIVAGDHARNDMAGEEEDSWGSQLKKAGFDVECHIVGLGELDEIQNMFVQHVREAK